MNSQAPLNSESRVDLHIHSNRSDGVFSAREIVDIAVERHVKAISITDHDDIRGLEETECYCRDKNIEFISGIEISARSKSFDLHLLGYFFDYRHPQLIEYVNFFQEERIKRAHKIIALLRNFGINLSFDFIRQKAGPGSIGRPHIADALVEEGHAYNYYDAFNRFIGDSCPCAVPKYKISPAEAIALINRAGGVCVIAHPGSDVTDDGLLELIKAGLNGIETIHPRHSREQLLHYRALVQKFGLIETGGSDCHGKHFSEILIGKMDVPYAFVEKMKRWMTEHHIRKD